MSGDAYSISSKHANLPPRTKKNIPEYRIIFPAQSYKQDNLKMIRVLSTWNSNPINNHLDVATTDLDHSFAETLINSNIASTLLKRPAFRAGGVVALTVFGVFTFVARLLAKCLSFWMPSVVPPLLMRPAFTVRMGIGPGPIHAPCA